MKFKIIPNLLIINFSFYDIINNLAHAMRIVTKKKVNLSNPRQTTATNVNTNTNTNNTEQRQRIREQNNHRNFKEKEEPKLTAAEYRAQERKLIDFVQSKGYKIVPMEGDGNCMFRAIGKKKTTKMLNLTND